jgi:hypothetical protein
MIRTLIPTHIYKGSPVRLIELTYEDRGEQYCTILMLNRLGNLQRQTVQERHLEPLVPADSYPTGGEEKA